MARWLASVVVLQAVAIAPVSAADIPLPKDDPFYVAPDPMPAAPPGTVLRSREVTIRAIAVDLPFRAWQLFYVSRDAHDRPAGAVTTLILPLTDSMTKPRPLVSYQTAEDSLDMKCAPSYRMRVGDEKEEVALPWLLTQGWAVAVHDYEGLQSQYTVGLQAGHAALDGIRAVLSFAPAGLGPATPVGLWGYSGGGHASAWAAELHPSYAPELNIVAVSEGGVPPDIRAVAKTLDGGPFSAIMLAGSVGMSRAYPELWSLWNEAGLQLAAEIGTMCIDEYTTRYMFEKMSTYSTVPDIFDTPLVQRVMALNHLGRFTPRGPIFLYHAIADELIPVADVNELVSEYCREGVAIWYHQDPASDHNSLAVSGGAAAVAYLAARFAGVAAPSNCGARESASPRAEARAGYCSLIDGTSQGYRDGHAHEGYRDGHAPILARNVDPDPTSRSFLS